MKLEKKFFALIAASLFLKASICNAQLKPGPLTTISGCPLSVLHSSPSGRYLTVRADSNCSAPESRLSSAILDVNNPEESTFSFASDLVVQADDTGAIYTQTESSYNSCQPSELKVITNGAARTLYTSDSSHQVTFGIASSGGFILVRPQGEQRTGHYSFCTAGAGTTSLYRVDDASSEPRLIWTSETNFEMLHVLTAGTALLGKLLIDSNGATRDLSASISSSVRGVGEHSIISTEGKKLSLFDIITGTAIISTVPGDLENVIAGPNADELLGTYHPKGSTLDENSHLFYVDRSGRFMDLTCHLPRGGKRDLTLRMEKSLSNGLLVISGNPVKFAPGSTVIPLDSFTSAPSYCPTVSLSLGRCAKYFKKDGGDGFDDIYEQKKNKPIPSNLTCNFSLKFANPTSKGAPSGKVHTTIIGVKGASKSSSKKISPRGSASIPISAKKLCAKNYSISTRFYDPNFYNSAFMISSSLQCRGNSTKS